MQHHKKVPQARLSQGLQPQKPPPQKNAPLSAAVESDVVGYTTITMEADKWYQVGNPFAELDDNEAPRVNDVLNTGFSEGDQLYIYDPVTAVYKTTLVWGKDGDTEGWLDGWDMLDQTTQIPVGQGVFIHKKAAGTVTFRGKVEAKESSFGAADVTTWNSVVSVYPTVTSINEVSWSNIEDGDEIYIYDSERSLFTKTRKWGSLPNGESGWLNDWGDGLETEISITPGQSFFVRKLNGIATCSPTVTK